MSLTADAQIESSASPSDRQLIAEIPPPMLAKLTSDSHQLALWISLAMNGQGLYWIFAPILHDSLVGLILGGILIVTGSVILARAYLREQPSFLRAELRYRRDHGKWRWER